MAKIIKKFNHTNYFSNFNIYYFYLKPKLLIYSAGDIGLDSISS